MLPILITAAIVLVGLWALSRAGEIFYVSIRNGRVLVVRGRVPQGLLNDFADAVRSPPVKRGHIRASKTAGGGRLTTGGVDEFREQRLRNIFRMYPVSNLRLAQSSSSDARRTIGQILGIAWLAWIFDRS